MKIVGVIRSIGERTENFSKFLLEKQVDEIKTLKNVKPLKKSLIEYLKIGLDYDFLVINDADVFIKPNCVNIMLEKLGNYPLITAATISKFFGKRTGGIRIFNSKYCQEMVDFLENSNSANRPEASVNRTFGGHVIKDVTSLHEYEQYYKDIYLRFIKHEKKSKPYLKHINNKQNDKDMDLVVAYRGCYDKVKDFNKSFPTLIEKSPIEEKDFKTLVEKYNL